MIGGGAALCAAVMTASPAASLPPEVQQQIDESFRLVLKNPGDTATNSAYAQRLIDAGNYETRSPRWSAS